MPRTKKKYNERIDLGYDADGNRVRKWIRADSAAEFKELKKQAQREIEQIRNPSEITFSAYSQKWYLTFKSNKEYYTQRAYKKNLKHCSALDGTKMKDLRSMDLQLVINEHFHQPRTCKDLRSLLKQIFRQAYKDGLIASNIAEDLEVPKYKAKEKRIITDAEMQKILQIKFNHQDQLYVDMLRNTGMRTAEALSLQWSDIDGQIIHVRRSLDFPNEGQAHFKSTKTGITRDIPISKEFADQLAQEPRSGLFVFLYEGHPIDHKTYKNLVRRILRKINVAFGGNQQMNVLNGLSLYSFRHTYATNLYYAGVRTGKLSTKKAAQIMGHSEEMFIKTYTHIDDSQEKIDEVLQSMSCVSNKQDLKQIVS